jgi:hypothetical protein
MSIIEELSNKTVFELKSYAKAKNIDIYGSKTKLEILEVIASWIPKDEIEPAVTSKPVVEKVAVHSTRNLHWNGLGALKIGYNIISAKDADKWATHRAVRIATPEEVASYYGK